MTEQHAASTGRGTAPATVVPACRADVLEQVMRSTGDDLLLIPFLHAEPASPEFFTAVGRLLTTQSGLVPAGSPLHRWSSPRPGALEASWRDACLPASMSLWGELAMLRQLHGPDADAADPYAELLALRART